MPEAPETGPYVLAAVFCEKVLQERDGVISAIRIIDQLTQAAAGPDPPQAMPPFLSELTMLVSLKAGDARGRHGVKIRPEAPGGFQLPAIEQAITFQAGAGGVNLIMQVALPIAYEGVYWFDVILTGPRPQEDRLLTRIPLEVIYAPQRVGGSEPTENPS
jgi:hypothetical protein